MLQREQKAASSKLCPAAKKQSTIQKTKTPLNNYGSLFISADQRYMASTHAARLQGFHKSCAQGGLPGHLPYNGRGKCSRRRVKVPEGYER
ncbi:MAG: hypothetical protein EBT59_09840 [Betaproteobacteria bacterium]|jgi:hypothetical protein|nr:hypothetical protein [Betaproteobacteria bacterium]NCX03630.1 hypothetical protein [Betaproteobacteria bacterium]